MNRKILWSAIIIVVLAVSIGGLYGWKVWWPEEQTKVDLGLSSPKFPWRDYTQAELEKLYPQIKNAAIPTRTTPEETYGKFREALRTNNLELAIDD